MKISVTAHAKPAPPKLSEEQWNEVENIVTAVRSHPFGTAFLVEEFPAPFALARVAEAINGYFKRRVIVLPLGDDFEVMVEELP